MKLKSSSSHRSPATLIRQFGDARLIRYRNGEHELVGGGISDRTAAYEWVSLFAHEIVFRHFHDRSASPPKVVRPLRILVTMN